MKKRSNYVKLIQWHSSIMRYQLSVLISSSNLDFLETNVLISVQIKTQSTLVSKLPNLRRKQYPPITWKSHNQVPQNSDTGHSWTIQVTSWCVRNVFSKHRHQFWPSRTCHSGHTSPIVGFPTTPRTCQQWQEMRTLGPLGCGDQPMT